jgi:hypothetical protein
MLAQRAIAVIGLIAKQRLDLMGSGWPKPTAFARFE